MYLCLGIFSFIVFNLDSSVGGPAAPFFRRDYVFNAETQNFYKIHTTRRNWNDALNRCKLEGATFFVPDSQQDRDAAESLVDAKFPKNPDQPLHPWLHIGVHDMFSEGEYVSVDGLSSDDFFLEWDESEPNNVKINGKDEDCVAMRRNGKMNDLDCGLELPFICKKARAAVEWNHLCDIPDSNYLYNKELGKCYKLHLSPKTWTDAYGTCSAEQSYLAIINSKAEADHFVKIVAEAPKEGVNAPRFYPNAIFAGFHNHFQNGWTTIKGQPLAEVGYYTWANGQPDNAGGTEKCGSMFFDGTLNDLTCELACFFVCEHDIGLLNSSLDERIGSSETTSPPQHLTTSAPHHLST